MKQMFSIIKNFQFLFVAFFSCISCSQALKDEDYLTEVFQKLSKIESASYLSTKEAWNPGDTVATYKIQHYVESYSNPVDTSIGVSWIDFKGSDIRSLDFAYDGNIRVLVYDEEKRIVIDSFKVRRLPFRPVSPPFYYYTKSIIQYALETTDSTIIEQKDLNDAIYVKLTILKDRQVEFFGQAHYIPESPYSFGDPTSIYELWIDKRTKLPYRYRREMSHNISVESVSNPKLNKLRNEGLDATKYFPKDYEIRQYGEHNKTTNPNLLLGKKAPEWTLTDPDGRTVRLSDFASEVFMVQFTSISCGPCRASIPFLKQLTQEFKTEDFDFVAIESTSSNSNALKNYMETNDFDYSFLISSNQVLTDYSIKAFPVFFIMNKEREIVEVISGYNSGSTDDQIRDAISKVH